jgi:hypothetical protein
VKTVPKRKLSGPNSIGNNNGVCGENPSAPTLDLCTQKVTTGIARTFRQKKVSKSYLVFWRSSRIPDPFLHGEKSAPLHHNPSNLMLLLQILPSSALSVPLSFKALFSSIGWVQ